MDPIRTAVKYALVPFRTIVQLGESFVGEEEQPPEVQPQPEPAQPRARKQQPRRASTQRRTRKADPQASQRPKELDDVGLARKVESVIFREETVPKGKIDVNAADGVVWLRGEAKTPEMIKELESQAAAIPEVKRVENLLHLPKTPAPTRTDTPPSQRKTQRSPQEPAERKVETAVTGETNGSGS
jgi:BON domain